MNKKNYITILFLLILLPVAVHAQSNYAEYSEKEKQSIFFDDFNTVKNDWSVGTFGNGCRRSKIENGYFQIESLCKDENPRFWTNLTQIDQSKDFEIETKLMFVKGEDNNSNALSWGDSGLVGDKKNYRYRFGISGNGQYRIDKYAGNWGKLKDWTPSDVIKKKQYNLLTVRKVSNKYYFFINKQLVHETDFQPFYGQSTGFQANQNTTIRIDFLRVSYLGKDLPAKDYAQSNYAEFSEAEKQTIFFDDFTTVKNDWSIGTFGNGCRRSKIENGYFQIESLCEKENPRFWTNLTQIDENLDFEIESKIWFVKGEDNNSNALSWGDSGGKGANKNYRYRFGVSGNGQYRIDKYSGSWENLKSWTKLDIINKNGYNLLTVRKVSSKYYFFINKQLVHQTDFQPFYGQSTGFQANQNTTIRIDFLRVSYLGKDLPGRDYAQSNYAEFSEEEKQTIFFDDFTTAKNDWAIGTFGNGCRSSKIENGYFQIESLCEKENPRFWTRMTQIDENLDFEIESKIWFVKGEDNNSNALSWGDSGTTGANKNYRYRFGVSGNGQYRIDKYSGSWENIKKWTKSGIINKNGYNLLTVRKVSNKYYLFLNKQQIHQFDFQPFYGQRIGFQANQNSTIRIDFLRVSYLKKEAFNAPPTIVIIEPEITEGMVKSSQEKITVAGRAIDTDGIHKVTINGIEARLQGDGYFSARLPLAVAQNSVSVRATDTKLKSSHKDFSIYREPTIAADPARTEGKRLALVIGNSDYEHGGSLANPVNDARSIKKILENLGFTVIKYENVTQRVMKKAMDQFGSQLSQYSVGLFFYAGHGVQVKGNNYLIPVDANLKSENDAEYDTVRADRVLGKMESAGSKTNIVILDACRDNPFERSWRRGAKGTGLAFMNAPSGSMIAYATSPGSTASDGTGLNGLYTSAILQHIQTPNITIEQMFKRVRSTIMERSGNKQVPWESTSLRGDFYFNNE